MKKLLLLFLLFISINSYGQYWTRCNIDGVDNENEYIEYIYTTKGNHLTFHSDNLKEFLFETKDTLSDDIYVANIDLFDIFGNLIDTLQIDLRYVDNTHINADVSRQLTKINKHQKQNIEKFINYVLTANGWSFLNISINGTDCNFKIYSLNYRRS